MHASVNLTGRDQIGLALFERSHSKGFSCSLSALLSLHACLACTSATSSVNGLIFNKATLTMGKIRHVKHEGPTYIGPIIVRQPPTLPLYLRRIWDKMVNNPLPPRTFSISNPPLSQSPLSQAYAEYSIKLPRLWQDIGASPKEDSSKEESTDSWESTDEEISEEKDSEWKSTDEEASEEEIFDKKMVVNYSKWDALELSDDSDVEVHPNVDKRSFIRAKQNQIHMEREKRRHEIKTLKYERIVNDGLLERIRHPPYQPQGARRSSHWWKPRQLHDAGSDGERWRP